MNMAKRGHISALIIFLWIAVQSSSQQFFGGSDCLLPRREGPCRARIPRFYYNAREQRCATFYYGGCQGNANNFESYEECEYRCRRSDSDTKQQQDACADAQCPPETTCVSEAEQCLFPPCAQFQCRPKSNPCDSSPCSNGEKCVYNPLIQCKKAPCAQYFCQKGNNNREDVCASVRCAQGQICQPRQKLCFLPFCPQHECVENPCHLVDCPPNRSQCVLVNGKAECLAGAPVDRNNNDKALESCSKLPQPGPCSTAVRRWYYNRQMSQCEQYRPGTCAPPNNANRFDSKLACEASCQNVPPCPPPLETKPGCGLVFQGLDQTTQCPIEQEMCEEAGMNCTSMQCSPGTTCTIMNGRARCMSGGKLENSNKLNKCSLLPDKGKCLASITRWYYNRQAGHCMQFAYGGCGGNLNRYNTLEQCERTCGDGGVPPCPTVTPPPVPSDCRLEGTELDTDLCPVPKIVCDRRNNCAVMHCPADSPCQMIDGLARCVKKPRDTHQLLLCSQLPDAGVGFESVQKWTYNRFTSRCEQFTYSGQGGNANRFLSKEQCEERCRGVEQCPMISVPARQPGCHYEGHETNRDTLCPQPKLVCGNERDVCADANCDPNSICQVVDGRAQCMPKEGVNGHVENEQALQLCSRLAQRGPCPAIIARWHYNRQTSRCEKFVYGGCQGNENNFETQSACERVCAGVARCPVTSALPAPVGCRHEGEELSDSLCPVPKLVCDEEEACKVCLTRESCQMTKSGAICQPATMSSLNTPLPNECELAKDSGSCDDQLPAFYFDSGAGKCLEFTYSGCQGNENRFSTLKQCERVCVAKRQCIIPPMVPPPAGCDYAISNDEEGCPIRHKLVCAHRMVIHN